MSDLFKTGVGQARNLLAVDNVFDSGQRFVRSQARLLEQRLFDTCFFGAPPAGVVDVLRGYQNDDGGFGHGLEPDVRCPASLPIDVEVAFKTLAAAGTTDDAMVRRACDFLTSAAGPDGAVAPAFPVIESYPRAAHWSEWTFEPGLNPTAGLAGLLYKLGIEHPWLAQATEYCWDKLENGGPPGDAHTLSEVMGFLEHVPDRERADKHATALAEHLATIPMFHLDPDTPGYGLTPLHLAPEADSRWRNLFTEAQINAHLDRLAERQQPDGGWTITWEPPSEASTLEWRGIVTLEALRTLVSYGRITADSVTD